jgi:hypothetical protein
MAITEVAPINPIMHGPAKGFDDGFAGSAMGSGVAAPEEEWNKSPVCQLARAWSLGSRHSFSGKPKVSA